MKQRTINLVFFLIWLIFFAGCGMNTGSQISGTGNQDLGGMKINISWPVTQNSRYIPPETNTISLSITGSGLISPVIKSYNKPSGDSLEDVIYLPVGTKTIEIKALSSSNAVLAHRISSFTITSGQVGTLTAILGVTITDTGFIPQIIKITPGTTLMWVNSGNANHTVTDNAGTFNSGTIASGQSWSRTFNNTGTVNYKDSLNPSLTGKVQAPTTAYVTNSESGTVSVIDTESNTVTATISVGDYPEGIAVNPCKSYAYIANNTNRMTVIDTVSNTVAATVTVGLGPTCVAVSPNGNYVYVTNRGIESQIGSVSVVNTASNTVAATVNVGINPMGIAVTPSGDFVYVVNNGGKSISVINAATNTVVNTISLSLPAGFYPAWIAMAPNGNYAYVSVLKYSSYYSGYGQIVVLNLATNSVSSVISSGIYNPFCLAVEPSGAYAYVTNNDAMLISTINTTNNTASANISGSSDSTGIAVTPDGRYAYVTDGNLNTVSVYDLSTKVKTATISVGRNAWGVAIK